MHDHPHGVLYTVTKEDWKTLQRAETGYSYIKLEVQLYDTTTCTAHAFISKPSLMLKKPVKPTQRYSNMLLSGACEHSLDSAYVDWLSKVEVHEGTALGKEYFDTPSVLYANLAVTFLALVFLAFFLR